MKRYLTVALGIVVVSACVTLAGTVAMKDSKHDLSTGSTGPTAGQAATDFNQICAFCHIPHQVAAATKQDPLWNHTLSSSGNYGIYASETLNANPTNFGGGTAGTANASQLCMSCHDGTIGVGSMYDGATASNSATTITAAYSVGTDLTNDHPVNFTYDGTLATDDGGLVSPDSVDSVDAAGIVPLFAGTMQCASCHDPHDDSNSPFLVVSTVDSALCAECHTK